MGSHGRLTVGVKATTGKERTEVPRVKERSGFRTARFLRSLDGATGVASLIFDTEADAQAQLDFVATNPLPGGPTITSTAVFEVILEV